MKPSCVALVLASTLVFVPAGASRTAAGSADGALTTASFSFAGASVTSIDVSADVAVARVTIDAPVGFGVTLDQPPGTRLGFALAQLSDVLGTSTTLADSDLVVDDPAQYASDPDAQACAPGQHRAVWAVTFAVLGQTFRLPFFVDAAAPGDASAPAAVIRFCPLWPSATAAGGGVTVSGLSLFTLGVLAPSTSPGRHTWSAFVTPPLASLAPDLSATFELRSVEPVPHALALRAQHDPKKKTVHLSGRVVAAGRPQAGVEVFFASSTSTFSDSSSFGPVTTNAAGEFSIRRPVTRSTQYTATAPTRQGPCTGPSTAPAGCVRETVSAPNPASAIVRVRRAVDPKLTARARDQAYARRINLLAGDFPTGWEAFESLSIFSCPGHNPRLSDLTATGEFESRIFATDAAVAASRSTVFVSEEQARSAFAREANIGLARCFANQAVANGGRVHELRRMPHRPLGNETRAFRLVYEQGDEVGYLDFVFFRRDRAVVHFVFASLAFPLELGDTLAQRVATRARRG